MLIVCPSVLMFCPHHSDCLIDPCLGWAGRPEGEEEGEERRSQHGCLPPEGQGSGGLRFVAAILRGAERQVVVSLLHVEVHPILHLLVMRSWLVGRACCGSLLESVR